MENYEQYFLEKIKADYPAAQAAMQKMSAYIEQSPAGGGEGCHSVHPLPIPKIYSQKTVKHFRQIVSDTYAIFAKVIAAYRKDPALRASFGFSRELEEYILRDCGYSCPLPIARFDIFYHEDTGNFKFCEINTDGTSAMNENLELANSLAHNPLYRDYLRNLEQKEQLTCRPFELFDSWISCFGKIYREYSGRETKPYVAIVDFLDKAYMADFLTFQQRFTAGGYETEICDIRKLRYREGTLYSPTGKKIDAIYRRAVTSDIFRDTAAVSDFLAACRDNAVCLVGSLQTQIIHNKQLFIVLHRPIMQEILSPGELAFVEKHVPYTNTLSEENVRKDRLVETKDRWILKPLDSYAAQGIYLGYEYAAEEWRDIIKSCYNNSYLYQEYYEPYRTPNIDLAGGKSEPEPFHNLTGLYVYGGELAGIYSRACTGRLIAGQFGGKELPTVYTTPCV